MTINKPLTLCALMLCGVFGAQAAGTNTITFTGKVIESACTISVNDGNASLDLGSTLATDIATSGQTGAPKEFNISLAGCPKAAVGVPTKAFVKFTGDTDGNTSYFKNTTSSESPATNTGVMLKDGKGTAIINNDGNGQINLPAEGGDISLTYSAMLVATANTPTQGDVSSTLTYTVSYE
ncbi:fimbrial protein SthA [Kluyvera intermedia]|uniref:fimbrial protein n=1 Tax=Kluyvera TaxID=579 RepID=UPI001F3CF231|nr:MULTISPECIES: fimbrial protein [Kluyvera]MCE9889719.1 fimbrial protein SthA [Kluyvera intermedia]WNN69968.1 fimbrial protein [Kluyvera cryocrescens]